MIWLKLFLLFSSKSHALMHQILFNKLHEARSGQQVARLQSEWHKLRVLKKACEIELQSDQVPLSCYSALNLEEKWGSMEKGRKAHLVEVLDRRCHKASEHLQLPALNQNLQNLSPKCQTDVREGWEIETYRAQNKIFWPEN